MAANDLVRETQVDALAAAIATAHNTHKTQIGTLATLTTTDKSNLVAAVNEVKASSSGAPPSASETVAGVVELATTAEATTGTDTTRAVTPAGVKAVRDALRTEILGAGVPAALDTLDELAAALADDDNFAATTTTALGNRVRVDAAQGLTAPQQAQGRANLGIVTSSADFAADFAAAVA